MNSIKILSLSILLISSVVSQASEIEILKDRFKKDFLLSGDQLKTFFVDEIEDWKESIRPDGSWKDIAYHLDDNAFTPGKHAARIDYLSRAYASKGHPYYQDPKVMEAIKSAFDFWMAKDIKSYNWWQNTIGIPQRFARCLLLVEDELGSNRIKAGLEILDRSQIQMTGQNRLWFSEIVFIRELFKENKRELAIAAGELHNIIKIAVTKKDEGILRDLSFYQHSIIYNGGYGAKYSVDNSRLLKIFNDTTYDFPASSVDLFSNFILDSQIWLTRGNKWDYSVTGRELVRKNKDARDLANACDILRKLNLPRKSEFQQCYEKLTGSENHLSGTKHFWLTDYMITQKKSFSMSVRMYSERTVNNDAPSNNEGLLSHHLADGATFLMQRGDEYQDIFPVWDWRHIPGTTTEKKTLKPAVFEPGNWDGFAHIRYVGKSSFVGGVTDGQTGIAAMDFISHKKYENLDARKSWYFGNKTIWALGNNIKCFGCKEVVTTIDQKRALGEVLVMEDDGTVSVHKGEKNYNNLKGIYHDGIAYFFPYAQDVTVSLENKLGDWNRINGQYSKDIVKENVFSAWINHNPLFVNEQYAYSIRPGLSKGKFLVHVSVKAFKQKSQWQAVKLEGKIYVTSYSAQDIRFAGESFRTEHPCAFIFNPQTNILTLSDPTQKLEKTFITVNGKRFLFKLPQGQERGKSKAFTL